MSSLKQILLVVVAKVMLKKVLLGLERRLRDFRALAA